MVIGNENHTLFWTSKYLGDSTLMFGFPTLYVVCGNPNPNAKISDMGTWNDNSWTGPYHGGEDYETKKR